MIKHDEFREYFELNNVPSDGHCLLHSIIECIKDNLNLNLSKEMMYYIITGECKVNIGRYIPYYKGTKLRFWQAIRDYIYNHKYDSSIGDLLPYVLSNGLNMRILIVDIPAEWNIDIKVYCIDPISQKGARRCVNCGKYLNILMHL